MKHIRWMFKSVSKFNPTHPILDGLIKTGRVCCFITTDIEASKFHSDGLAKSPIFMFISASLRLKTSPLSLPFHIRWISSSTSTKTTTPPQHFIHIFTNARHHQNHSECKLALVSALKSCSSLSLTSQGRQIHSLTFKLGLHSNIFIQNSLINMYAKCGSISDAQLMFQACPRLDFVSCNIMLSGYVRAGLFGEALEVFKDMRCCGVVPNDLTLIYVISACSYFGEILNCRMVHGLVGKLLVDRLVIVSNNLIHAYCLCSGVKEARRLFDEMPQRDVVSWNTMISGYAHTEQPKMALELFHKMVASGIKPNEVTMVGVFFAIATLGTLQEGRLAHEYMRTESIPFHDNLRAALIDMYAKCGSINDALQFFNQIRDKVYSVPPWNAIICGLASHGHASMCLEVFCDMQRYHIKPNHITFIGVLRACCHAGLVEFGQRIFKRMNSAYNVEPDIRHYGCMIDLLGRSGLLEEAEETIRSMPMEPNVVIWGTLLAVCRTHGNVNIGEKAAENLARLEPSHGGGKVLLSNIYADVDRWEDVSFVRSVMQSQTMDRVPGCNGIVR